MKMITVLKQGMESIMYPPFFQKREPIHTQNHILSAAGDYAPKKTWMPGPASSAGLSLPSLKSVKCHLKQEKEIVFWSTYSMLKVFV